MTNKLSEAQESLLQDIKSGWQLCGTANGFWLEKESEHERKSVMRSTAMSLLRRKLVVHSGNSGWANAYALTQPGDSRQGDS